MYKNKLIKSTLMGITEGSLTCTLQTKRAGRTSTFYLLAENTSRLLAPNMLFHLISIATCTGQSFTYLRQLANDNEKKDSLESVL